MKRDLLFRAFRSYMRFVHDSLYYRNVDIIGRENVPEYGTPTLVVANHQSALSDPIGLHFAFHKEKVTIFARGDIFNNPKLGRFFRWIGLLPAYRLRTDGEENLDRNYGAFEEAGDRLLDGGIVAIFPEAVNQDKHWLGEWSQGYLRMAFETAESDGFKTDIKVLPAAVHYSHYFSARKDLVIKFGEPMSLMPYYERYKSKPRTVWREVNAEMRRRVGEMMLNITDLENYDAIDYIRETYGVRYARKRGANPRSLPERLITDKELCGCLEQNSDELKDVYAEALALKEFTKREKLKDWVFDYHWSWWRAISGVLFLLVMLPLYLFALIPHILIFYAPEPLAKKFTAKGNDFTAYTMFVSGIRYVVSALFSMPICYGAVFVVDWCLMNFWVALLHVMMLPVLGRFAWYYRLYFIKLRGVFRYRRGLKRGGEYREWKERRSRLFDKLEEICF